MSLTKCRRLRLIQLYQGTNSGIDLSRDSFAFAAREKAKMRKFGGSRPIFISLSQNFAPYQKLKNNYLYLAGSFAVTELNSFDPV